MVHEAGFDLDKAIEATKHYSNATSVSVIIIDDTGETLFSTNSENEFCHFCFELKPDTPSGMECRNAHLYGSYQAERFGGKYVFFCPFGMAHWSCPITIDGIMKGALLGGPVHMIEPEEFLLEDLFKKYDNNELVSKAISLSKKIPIVSTDKVNSLSELLRLIAFYLSDTTWHQYSLNLQEQEQAADISDYIHKLNQMTIDDEKILAYPIRKEKELQHAIALGDKRLSQKLLNEILGHIYFASGNNFELIRARILELVVILSRAALEGGADIKQIFGLNFQYLKQINRFHNLEELTLWLSRIMERFTDHVFNLANIKRKDVIFKSIDYIRKNYMKKVTLDEVAACVYLSPSYFSKVFKQEMEMSFNTYLNYIRIEMSKKLLSDPSIAIVDISNLVGFEDQSYFSKVFKKMTGLSPKKFREQGKK
jgi:two-component system response regulator YesN